MGQTNQKINKGLIETGYAKLPDQYKMNTQNCFESQRSQIKVKAYMVLINTNQISLFISHLQFRRQHEAELIQIKFIDLKKAHQDFCKLFVYIEQITVNLEQVMAVHFNHMIKILYFALKGFKILFEKFGYFDIETSMIGVNDIGQLKVWMNKKYNQYVPKSTYSYLKPTEAEIKMVSSLKDIFKCKTNKFTIPHNFLLKSVTFQELIDEISQKNTEQNFLINKIQLSQSFEEPAMQFNQKSTKSDIKCIAGAQIRFNYSTTNNSNPRITFNGKCMSVAKTNRQLRSTSIKNVRFSYEKPARERQSSPVRKLDKQLLQSAIEPMESTKSGLGKIPKITFVK